MYYIIYITLYITLLYLLHFYFFLLILFRLTGIVVKIAFNLINASFNS